MGYPRWKPPSSGTNGGSWEAPLLAELGLRDFLQLGALGPRPQLSKTWCEDAMVMRLSWGW